MSVLSQTYADFFVRPGFFVCPPLQAQHECQLLPCAVLPREGATVSPMHKARTPPWQSGRARGCRRVGLPGRHVPGLGWRLWVLARRAWAIAPSQLVNRHDALPGKVLQEILLRAACCQKGQEFQKLERTSPVLFKILGMLPTGLHKTSLETNSWSFHWGLGFGANIFAVYPKLPSVWQKSKPWWYDGQCQAMEGVESGDK